MFPAYCQAGTSVDLALADILAVGNADEAVKVSEEEEGAVLVDVRSLDIEGDVEVEEENQGDLHVTPSGPAIGDDLKLKQGDEGIGSLRVRGSSIADDVDLDGDITEVWPNSTTLIAGWSSTGSAEASDRVGGFLLFGQQKGYRNFQ